MALNSVPSATFSGHPQRFLRNLVTACLILGVVSTGQGQAPHLAGQPVVHSSAPASTPSSRQAPNQDNTAQAPAPVTARIAEASPAGEADGTTPMGSAPTAADGSTGTVIVREAASGKQEGASSNGSQKKMLQTVIGSLAVVLGAFMLLVWLFRRNSPNAGKSLPDGVLQVLGSLPAGNRSQYQLLRLGYKLVLVHVHANGVETISEINDPREADRVAALCQQGQSNSITESFRQVLEQFGDEPAQGFLDSADRSDQDLASQGGRQRSRRPNRSRINEVV